MSPSLLFFGPLGLVDAPLLLLCGDPPFFVPLLIFCAFFLFFEDSLACDVPIFPSFGTLPHDLPPLLSGAGLFPPPLGPLQENQTLFPNARIL